MARLTIEVSHRHQHQFYKVEKPVVRIGRALDNDIILPDPAVSPHHLLIRTTPAGGHEVVSLADVSPDELLVHDEDGPASLAFFLSRMRQPAFPEPIGVFRDVQKIPYEEGVLSQIDQAVATRGKGDLRKLLLASDTWEVGPEHTNGHN